MANHLVIGLGGTGGSVLRSLRKRIYEEFRSNDPEGKVHIEYLYVDSSLADLNNEEDWQTLGTSVQLSPAQRLSINGIGSGVLANLDQYPGINSFINKNDERMMQEGIGAIIDAGIGGQRRRFGRMLIANNMCGLPQDTFVGQVHSRVRVLKEQEDVDDVTFHICAGLGGGTGSGSIVDAVAQIRNEFQRTGDDRSKYKIQLYLYVPEKIIQIPGGEASNRFYQPNGYAALLELNAMSVGVYHPTDVLGNTDEFGHVRRLLKGQDAFDIAYLYTNVNENGKEVNIHKVLPTIVGDFLFQKIVASSMVKSGQMERLISNENNGLLPEENESQEAVHSRQFMTFGVNRIEYPETEVVEYGAYNYAQQASVQMLYGLWDEARGFIECTEDMVGKTYVHDVKEQLESNLLSDEYLTLGKPLPSIEKSVTNWKPVVSTWNMATDRYKADIMKQYPKKEWLPQYNIRTTKYYETMFRSSGVLKFYFDSEPQIKGYAEEIVRHIENKLLIQWKNGEMSILEVQKYLAAIVTHSQERIEKFKATIERNQKYIDNELVPKLKECEVIWQAIGWLRDVITNASTKTFERYCSLMREVLIMRTQIVAFGFASKLLSEVCTLLRVLSNNSIANFRTTLTEFADKMITSAGDKCKLSDGENLDLKCEVAKEYDPHQVRSTVQTFLLNKQKQSDYATDLRNQIIDSVGSMTNGFSGLAKKINVSTLFKIALKVCIKNARKDMEDYSIAHPTMRLVNVNILDKLRNTVCSTDDKRKQFARDIYGAAQSFLTFNRSEEGKGSPETAAKHRKLIQISLPLYEEDPAFRDDFIKDFGESGNIPFTKDEDVSVNFKSNQIVVVTAHSGFPLRYVDNVRVLKEKYDILVRNEVNRMVVHTESFKSLPSVYNKSNEEAQKELMPLLLLAYSIPGLIYDRENVETGLKEQVFDAEKNPMGIVSRRVCIGDNIVDTLQELSKLTRSMDVVALNKAVRENLDANYKHISKKQELMMAMGKTLQEKLLPLLNNNENDLLYMAFCKAGNKLCEDNLEY